MRIIVASESTQKHCFGWKDVRASDYAFHTDGYRVTCTRTYTLDTWEGDQKRERSFLEAVGYMNASADRKPSDNKDVSEQMYGVCRLGKRLRGL